MDPKYKFCYTDESSDSNKVASLTGRGPLQISRSHWLAVVCPSLTDNDPNGGRHGAPQARMCTIYLLELEWGLLRVLHHTPRLLQVPVGGWSTRLEFLSGLVKNADENGLLSWNTTFTRHTHKVELFYFIILQVYFIVQNCLG